MPSKIRPIKDARSFRSYIMNVWSKSHWIGHYAQMMLNEFDILTREINEIRFNRYERVEAEHSIVGLTGVISEVEGVFGKVTDKITLGGDVGTYGSMMEITALCNLQLVYRLQGLGDYTIYAEPSLPLYQNPAKRSKLILRDYEKAFKVLSESIGRLIEQDQLIR